MGYPYRGVAGYGVPFSPTKEIEPPTTLHQEEAEEAEEVLVEAEEEEKAPSAVATPAAAAAHARGVTEERPSTRRLPRRRPLVHPMRFKRWSAARAFGRRAMRTAARRRLGRSLGVGEELSRGGRWAGPPGWQQWSLPRPVL